MQQWLIEALEQKLQTVIAAVIPRARLRQAPDAWTPRDGEPWLWLQKTLDIAPGSTLTTGLSAASAAEVAAAVRETGFLGCATPEESSGALLRMLANACAGIAPGSYGSGTPSGPPDGEMAMFSLEWDGAQRHTVAVALAPALVRAMESRHIPEAGPALLHVDLPVSISLGHARLEFRNLVRLAAGSVVELDRMVGEPVDVTVNDSVIARGEIVVVEGNYGVRIQSVSGTGWRSAAGFRAGQ